MAPVMRATGDMADTVFDRDHCARPPADAKGRCFEATP
jgi:hypothetical protein